MTMTPSDLDTILSLILQSSPDGDGIRVLSDLVLERGTDVSVELGVRQTDGRLFTLSATVRVGDLHWHIELERPIPMLDGAGVLELRAVAAALLFRDWDLRPWLLVKVARR